MTISATDGLEKVSQLLGLARRAGKLSIGASDSLPAISGKRAYLVFLASDAGDNTSKKVRDKCAFYNVPVYHGFNRTQLGRGCGYGQAVVITVNNHGFAAKIQEYLVEMNWEV